MQKEQPNRYLQISTVGSRSGGLDLAGMRSNLGHCLQIGRPRVKGARSGGAARREQGSTAALDRSRLSGGYSGSFGSRLGAKERVRHV